MVSYRPDSPCVEHLICHELTHLKFILQARLINENQHFTSGEEESLRFQKWFEPTVKKLKSDGLPIDAIIKFIDRIFQGLNSRVFNTRIDLFIEDL